MSRVIVFYMFYNKDLNQQFFFFFCFTLGVQQLTQVIFILCYTVIIATVLFFFKSMKVSASFGVFCCCSAMECLALPLIGMYSFYSFCMGNFTILWI